VSRFQPVLRAYLEEIVPDGRQNEIARTAGVSQGSLSMQRKGDRLVTLEMLDRVAHAQKQSVQQALTRIRDLSQEGRFTLPEQQHFNVETPESLAKRLANVQPSTAAENEAAPPPRVIGSPRKRGRRASIQKHDRED
jgi:hypothetical protein